MQGKSRGSNRGSILDSKKSTAGMSCLFILILANLDEKLAKRGKGGVEIRKSDCLL